MVTLALSTFLKDIDVYHFLLIFFIASIGVSALGTTALAKPQNFSHMGGMAVFVDFQQANYDVSINFKLQESPVVSTVDFYQDIEGYPLFDIINDVSTIEVDGQPVEIISVSTPDGATELRTINKILRPGRHTLRAISDFDEYMGAIDYALDYADVAVHLGDLVDRGLLEIVVVANLEYDQYKMTFNFHIESTHAHKIYTNGSIKTLSNNHFQVLYPSYFTSSSPFIHISKKGLYKEVEDSTVSVTGRRIPILVYSNDLNIARRTMTEALALISEFEDNFGPWPHPELLISAYDGGAGMEYAGALVSGTEAIWHEMAHSYFARGVFPLNGKSGWIDEAIARWIENGYKSITTCRDNNCSLGLDKYPEYQRHTTLIYDDGAYFIDLLHRKFSKKGGMISFLKYFFKKNKFIGITTESFKLDLEIFFGDNLTEEFREYVYGGPPSN